MDESVPNLFPQFPPPHGEKRCSSCGIAKPLEAFHRHKNGSQGRAGHCKACRAQFPTYNYKAEGVRSIKAELTNRQAGRCAACGARPDKGVLCLDHDHVSGNLRGMLCQRCNLVLGKVQDSPVLLRSLLSYLMRYGHV